jgi:hypothetical protein
MHVYVNTQILQLLEGGLDQWGVSHGKVFFWFESHRRQQIFELYKIEEIDLHVLGRL